MALVYFPEIEFKESPGLLGARREIGAM